jgi:hypothetical protein
MVQGLFLVADGKFVPAFCPAAGKNFPAVFSGHSLAKAVSVFAFALMGLVCAFHQ